jgi:hypothetical protein
VTILSICQDAALELSLVTPTSVVATTDDTAKKLGRHLSKVCLALAKRHDWQILRREQTFITSSTDAQTGAIPSDFLRFIQGTMYNRTQRRPVMGPMTGAEWQSYKASNVNPVDPTFYQRGNSIVITPPSTEGETVAYEYITKFIGTDTSGETARERFSGDDDVPYFNDEVLTLGVVASYRQAERLDYAEEFRQFELAVADMLKQDGGRRILDMDDMRRDPTWRVNGGLLDYFVTTT